MKVTADTNILVRAAVNDDEAQARAASMDVLRGAELIAVPMAAMCEFVWVLRSALIVYTYNNSSGAIKVCCVAKRFRYRLAIHAGLAALNAGGDFADGVIA